MMQLLARMALLTSLVGWVAMAAQPVSAQTQAPAQQAVLTGTLGYEGGPYPGGFHPTAGTVQVAYTDQPLVMVTRVGPSGHFKIDLGPGTYRVTGCGPKHDGSQMCGKPRTITLTAGEVDHVRLVWALTP
jgi:hypothetical protein